MSISCSMARMKAANVDLIIAGTITRETVGVMAETRKLGWNVRVLTTLPGRSSIVVKVGKEAVEAYQREEAEKVLGPATQFLMRHGINPKSVAKVGHAGETLCKAANAGGFDLVVMGSHGHGVFGNLVMGSVATQVLSHSKVPVLLVR